MDICLGLGEGGFETRHQVLRVFVYYRSLLLSLYSLLWRWVYMTVPLNERYGNLVWALMGLHDHNGMRTMGFGLAFCFGVLWIWFGWETEG